MSKVVHSKFPQSPLQASPGVSISHHHHATAAFGRRASSLGRTGLTTYRPFSGLGRLSTRGRQCDGDARLALAQAVRPPSTPGAPRRLRIPHRETASRQATKVVSFCRRVNKSWRQSAILTSPLALVAALDEYLPALAAQSCGRPLSKVTASIPGSQRRQLHPCGWITVAELGSLVEGASWADAGRLWLLTLPLLLSPMRPWRP